MISLENQNLLFIKKGKLYLIGICSGKYFNPNRIKNTLELLFTQLLSIITTDRIPLIERKPYTCAESMSGTETLFEQSVSYSHNNLPCMIGCFEVMIFEKEARLKLTQILKQNLGNALLCLCLTKHGLLSYVSGEYVQVVHHSDVLLIYNFLHANEGLISNESWIPICLPGISDRGFLQMYSKFIEVDKNASLGIAFITESQDPTFFMNFSQQAENIVEECVNSNLISIYSEEQELMITPNQASLPQSKLRSACNYRKRKCGVNEIPYNSEQLMDNFISKLSFTYTKMKSNTELFDQTQYLACRHKIYNQCFTKGFEDYDYEKTREDEKMIKLVFASLYDEYCSNNEKRGPNHFICETNKVVSSIVALLESESFIVIASFSLFKDQEEVYTVLQEVAKQIKNTLDQYYILP